MLLRNLSIVANSGFEPCTLESDGITTSISLVEGNESEALWSLSELGSWAYAGMAFFKHSIMAYTIAIITTIVTTPETGNWNRTKGSFSNQPQDDCEEEGWEYITHVSLCKLSTLSFTCTLP